MRGLSTGIERSGQWHHGRHDRSAPASAVRWGWRLSWLPLPRPSPYKTASGAAVFAGQPSRNRSGKSIHTRGANLGSRRSSSLSPREKAASPAGGLFPYPASLLSSQPAPAVSPSSPLAAESVLPASYRRSGRGKRQIVEMVRPPTTAPRAAHWFHCRFQPDSHRDEPYHRGEGVIKSVGVWSGR